MGGGQGERKRVTMVGEREEKWRSERDRTEKVQKGRR